MARTTPTTDPLWYKDAIIYELHVRAFSDSNADGIGDFKGLAEKLDYLQDLGVTAIWLLPFYPSPLRDDGYDIADYTEVNPMYGDLPDVRNFIKEAHKRGLKVITELVCNHTSDQHPWFQRARRAPPGSALRNWYVWSDTPDKYTEARIIFKDTETSNWTWDPVANAYFWHRFFSHQPDLNFESPQVQKAVFKAMDFWLEMGVDGLRLDAVPYLYEAEGTNCENLPQTHVFLKQLRARIDAKFPGRLLLAEANQWPEDSVAYFGEGEGDECNMAFHFPVMPRLYMALRMEDRFPIIDILDQTPAIPPTAQWAMFLRNHDELTLEMVTDEERDYMYRVYASDQRARINLGIRRRLAPLLDNNRRRIELMNGLLFSMPGTPVLYYGDEIGMGDNIYLGDRNGVRTPMQWSADRNAGFSKASPQRLYFPVVTEPEYNYETINVEAQQNNTSSLLWWMKRIMALRKRYQAFGRGSIEFLQPDNRKVLAFVRRYENEQILVVANLSRFVQSVDLDLSQCNGCTPIEMFGRSEFPVIKDQSYLMTLGPHSFYWFELQPQSVESSSASDLPELVVSGAWQTLLDGQGGELVRLLPHYLKARRWFRGKARTITGMQLVDVVPIQYSGTTAQLTFVQVNYTEGDPEVYVLPLAFATGEQMTQLEETPYARIAQLRSGTTDGILYDPSAEAGFEKALLDIVSGQRRLRGKNGEIVGAPTRALRPVLREGTPEPTPGKAEQSNSSIIYGDKLILKLFRKVESGINPDLELGRVLTDRNFVHTSQVMGAIDYRPRKGEAMSLAILQGFVSNQGDAWSYTLDALGRYFERALSSEITTPDVPPLTTKAVLELGEQETPALACDLLGTYAAQAELLGQRTAEMHLALTSETDDVAFTTEPFTSLYQRSIYQSMRTQASRSFQTLRKQAKNLPERVRDDAQALIGREADVLARFRSVADHKMVTARARFHGDYHLGQVLYTGKDFVIIDFEGEPARPLGERRVKHSPLRDVAGMLRSFQYAASAALLDLSAGASVRPEDVSVAETWAHYWSGWVSVIFLKSYLDTVGTAAFIPANRDELALLLDAFQLEKAAYELNYELNNRPDWVRTPISGILRLIETTA